MCGRCRHVRPPQSRASSCFPSCSGYTDGFSGIAFAALVMITVTVGWTLKKPMICLMIFLSFYPAFLHSSLSISLPLPDSHSSFLFFLVPDSSSGYTGLTFLVGGSFKRSDKNSLKQKSTASVLKEDQNAQTVK